MRGYRAVVIPAGVAHVLSWISTLWLALWPAFYQGVSATVAAPGSLGDVEVKRTSASLIEVNGLWVLPLLAVPVALTALGFAAALSIGVMGRHVKGVLWASALLLALFCLVGIWSIGLLYLPAALALVVSATMASRRPSPGV